MKSAQQWFDEYGDSHQNPKNKLIHWICVPVIYWTVVAVIWSMPFPEGVSESPWLNWATLVSVVVVAFYFRLSLALGLGMSLFSLGCLWLSYASELYLQQSSANFSLWQLAIGVFVLAWIGQFIGHAIEGKKPSFFKDVQFLLIGPAWLMGFILKRLKISL